MKCQAVPLIGLALLSVTSTAFAGDVEPRAKLTGHKGWLVRSLALTADGKTLAWGGGSGKILISDAATGKKLALLRYRNEDLDIDNPEVETLALAPDGRMLAAVGFALWPVELFDLQTRNRLKAPPAELGEGGWPVLAFTPDGKVLAYARLMYSSSDDRNAEFRGGVTLWDVRAAKNLSFHKVKGMPLAFSPDGQAVVTRSRKGGWVKVWNARKGTEQVALQTGDVRCVAFSPKDRLLATTQVGGSLKSKEKSGVSLWDLSSGKRRRVLNGHSGSVEAMAFSPDGSLLASAGEDRSVRLWDVARGREVATLKGHSGSVHCLAFSGDGKTLASAGATVTSAGADSMVLVWDVQKLLTRKAQK
jgi:WD40 repeat protein